MAKHTADKPKVLSKQDKTRMKHMASLELLMPKAQKFIEECLDAVRPCSYCRVDGDKVIVAKRDAEGKCIECHGTNLVPDKESRKWAAEEVASRIVPKPKAVEMEVDDKREVDEWMAAAEAMDDDAVAKLAEQMKITFQGQPPADGNTGA